MQRLRWSEVLFALLPALVLLLPSPLRAEDTSSVESEIESLQRELDSADAPSREDSSSRETTNSSNSVEETIEKLESDIESKTRGETASEAAVDSGAEATEPAGSVDSTEESISAWDLYRDPILCALIAGAILGLLGVYVVARRIVFVSAALSQVSALGITIGFFTVAFAGLGGLLHDLLPPAFAVLLAVPIVYALTYADDAETLPRDALLGAAFVIPMALVLVLGPYIPQEMHEIESILHGSAVLVSTTDLYAVAVAGALILATQIAGFRAFVFASLDPLVARTQGLPVRALDAILFGSVALMTGLVTRALGALPTFGLTVLPAIGALRLKIGLAPVFVTAAATGALAGGGGYGLAYAMNWSVGAAQTLLAATLMVLLRLGGRLLD